MQYVETIHCFNTNTERMGTVFFLFRDFGLLQLGIKLSAQFIFAERPSLLFSPRLRPDIYSNRNMFLFPEVDRASGSEPSQTT